MIRLICRNGSKSASPMSDWRGRKTPHSGHGWGPPPGAPQRSAILAPCHPRAASRRPGRSRKAPRASSCGTATSRRWRISISRTSQAGAQVRSCDARRGVPYRGEYRKAAKRAAADFEGHSAAAEFGQSGGLSGLQCQKTQSGEHVARRLQRRKCDVIRSIHVAV